MKPEEFDRLVQPAPIENEPDCEFEDQTLIDVRAAIDILSTTKTLLDFVGNPDLIKTVTKRERAVMARVSEEIRCYLAEVVPTYEDAA